MNRIKLQQYEEKKNRLQFPLKLKEYNIKLLYNDKIKEYKNTCKSINEKIIKKYQKNQKTINHLSDYIDKITNDIFKDNLYSKEKKILKNLETNINMIKDYEEQKKKLYIYDKEELEDKLGDLFKIKEMHQKKKFEYLKKETKYHFDLHKKLNEEFEDTKNELRNPSDNFEFLINDNRHMITKLEIIKNINMKLNEIYKKEKKYYLELLQNKAEKNNINQILENNKKVICNDDKKTNEKNKNKIIKRNIKRNKSTLTNNYYDIFNCYYYNNNKDNKIFTINNLKKELSTINDINAFSPRKTSKFFKRTELKKCLSSNKIFNKKNLSIQTNLNSLIQNDYSKSISITSKSSKHRVLSANSPQKVKIKNNLNINNENDNKEKIFLMNIHDFLKKHTETRKKYIIFMRQLISDEIKTLLWVKDFITKLIKELRYDIDDVNKNIALNNKMNINNDDLKIRLKENEKYLNFCTYFFDNCLKGNNKIKYLLD